MPLTLDLAGIFFVAAVEHAALGEKAYRQAKEKLANFQNPFTQIGPLHTRRLARKSLKNISEEHLTDSLREIRRLEPLYEPVVRDFAIATIAAVAAAETYANEIADIVLPGKAERNVFDKLPVQGKWLFLPNFIERKKRRRKLFSMDQGPLQAFCDAVRRRNTLVHFKGIASPIGKSPTPEFLEELGLDPRSVQKAIDSVRNLIQEFSLEWKGSYGPGWLHPEEEDFRRPCFVVGNREAGMVLWADELDAQRLQEPTSQPTSSSKT